MSEGFIINAYGDEVEPSRLKVFRVLDESLNPLTSDFTILGFKKVSPNYIRGRKTEALYKCFMFDECVVKKTFTDILDSTGNLVALEVKFDFYAENGSVGATKTEIVKTFNKAEAKTEKRKRRGRQVDYMLAGAEGTPIEPYVNALIHHYSSEVDLYITHGTSDWEDAINNESDQTILSYLSIVVPRLDDPTRTISIKDSMLYQLTGILPE